MAALISERDPANATAPLACGAEGALEAAIRIVTARTKARALDEAEIQLLACELLAADYLPDAAKATSLAEARKVARAFASWLDTLKLDDLLNILEDR